MEKTNPYIARVTWVDMAGDEYERYQSFASMDNYEDILVKYGTDVNVRRLEVFSTIKVKPGAGMDPNTLMYVYAPDKCIRKVTFRNF